MLATGQNLDLLTPIKKEKGQQTKEKGQQTLPAADKLYSEAVSRIIPIA